jgi:hypothetical protein
MHRLAVDELVPQPQQVPASLEADRAELEQTTSSQRACQPVGLQSGGVVVRGTRQLCGKLHRVPGIASFLADTHNQQNKLQRMQLHADRQADRHTWPWMPPLSAASTIARCSESTAASISACCQLAAQRIKLSHSSHDASGMARGGPAAKGGHHAQLLSASNVDPHL